MKKIHLVPARRADNYLTIGVVITIIVIGVYQRWYLYYMIEWLLVATPAALFWRTPLLLLQSVLDKENSEYYMNYLKDYLVPSELRNDD